MKKTIVITGVTRGLGRAMVDEFIRLGHTVFGCARTKDQIERLGGIYPKHDFQCVDVSSDAQVKVWAKNLLKIYGPPDFVLNNAAVINPKASLWKVADRDFSEEIDINVKGVVNVIRHFVPSMIKRKKEEIRPVLTDWGNRLVTRLEEMERKMPLPSLWIENAMKPYIKINQWDHRIPTPQSAIGPEYHVLFVLEKENMGFSSQPVNLRPAAAGTR